MKDFGSRLKAALDAADVSQTELANYVSRSKGAISQWVHNQAEPDFATLNRICDRLKVSADYLVRGVDSMYVAGDSFRLAERIQSMQPDSRKALFDLIFGKAVSDEQVEHAMPVTRRNPHT